eukprot:scaffold3362_cov402-Prasinococcus_capsulatus_cf.AAC.8
MRGRVMIVFLPSMRMVQAQSATHLAPHCGNLGSFQVGEVIAQPSQQQGGRHRYCQGCRSHE